MTNGQAFLLLLVFCILFLLAGWDFFAGILLGIFIGFMITIADEHVEIKE